MKRCHGKRSVDGAIKETHPAVLMITESMEILKTELRELSEKSALDLGGCAAWEATDHKNILKAHGMYECCVRLTDFDPLAFVHAGVPPGLGRGQFASNSSCFSLPAFLRARSNQDESRS